MTTMDESCMNKTPTNESISDKLSTYYLVIYKIVTVVMFVGILIFHISTIIGFLKAFTFDMDYDVATFQDRPHHFVYKWAFGNTDFFQEFGHTLSSIQTTHVILGFLSALLTPIPTFLTLKGSIIHELTGLSFIILITIVFLFGSIGYSIIIIERGYNPCAFVIIGENDQTSYSYAMFLEIMQLAIFMSEFLVHGFGARVLIPKNKETLTNYINKYDIYCLKFFSFNTIFTCFLTNFVYFTIIFYFRIIEIERIKCQAILNTLDLIAYSALFIVQLSLLKISKSNIKFTNLVDTIYVTKDNNNNNNNKDNKPTRLMFVNWRKLHGKNLVVMIGFTVWTTFANVFHRWLPIITPITGVIVSIFLYFYWKKHINNDNTRLNRKNKLNSGSPSVATSRQSSYQPQSQLTSVP